MHPTLKSHGTHAVFGIAVVVRSGSIFHWLSQLKTGRERKYGGSVSYHKRSEEREFAKPDQTSSA